MKILYIPIIALLITACNDTGIFYTLENEKKIEESNNLPNSSNFGNIVQAGSNYIGNAGIKVWFRSDSSIATADDWYSLTMPSRTSTSEFSTDATTTSMILFNDTDLYISRISYDSSSVVSGLFRLTNADTRNLADVTAADWLEVVDGTTARSGAFTANIYKLHYAEGSGPQPTLYINHLVNSYSSTDDESATLTSSSLFVSTTPESIGNNLQASNAVVDEINLINLKEDTTDNTPYEVTKITSGGQNYWMIFNDEEFGNVYRSTDSITFTNVTSAFPETSSESTTPVKTRYVDIYEHSDPNILLFSNTDGSLYTSINANTATASSIAFIALTKGSAYLNGFCDIHSIEPYNILVGSLANAVDGSVDSDGYYQIDLSDVYNDAGENPVTHDIVWNSTNFSDPSNYSSGNLDIASINGFLFDETASRIFAYTWGEGVWMNIVNVDNPLERIWSHE